MRSDYYNSKTRRIRLKAKLTMKSLIGNLLFVAVLLLIAARFLSVFSGSFFPIDIVTAESMSPTLIKGDLIAWTPTNINDVKIGDVIVFKSWLSWPEEKLIVHRVVDVKKEFGKVALVTKGDANNYTDQAGPHIPEPVRHREKLHRKINVYRKHTLENTICWYYRYLD